MNLFQKAITRLIASLVITSSAFSTLVTLPAQAQTAPIGMNSRIPGVNSLGTYPGFKGVQAEQSGYYPNVCKRWSGGQYGRLIHAQPYYNGNVSCTMERACFMVTYKQQYSIPR